MDRPMMEPSEEMRAKEELPWSVCSSGSWSFSSARAGMSSRSWHMSAQAKPRKISTMKAVEGRPST